LWRLALFLPLSGLVSTNPLSDPDRSLLIDDAAQLLGVSRRTIYYRIREGRLRTIRTRCGSQRVLVSSIDTLLRERREREPRARAASRRVSEAEPLAL
jgi:excisionase family DNA binding protein